MFINLCTFIVLCVLIIRYAEPQATSCPCVPINTCYQNLASDGSGQIDIRIVNSNLPSDGSGQIDIRIVNSGTGTVTLPPVPTVVPPPPIVTCQAGTESCCTGLTGCGVRWNITPTATTTPAVGQARYGSQPWAALILGIDNSYVGGGVLLDTLNVLTVAHKVANRTAATIKVRMGEWDTNRVVETFVVQESLISIMRIHPQYMPSNLTNDVAILRLATPIQLGPVPNPAINTACLPPATMVSDNMRCLVSGWGQDAFVGPVQAILKEVDVPILTNADCLARLRTTRLGAAYNLDVNNFICAGGEVGRDACIGDGGAGLMCNVGGKYQLIGLVAWGIGCATANVPGVYVRVQNFLPWIQQNQV